MNDYEIVSQLLEMESDRDRSIALRIIKSIIKKQMNVPYFRCPPPYETRTYFDTSGTSCGSNTIYTSDFSIEPLKYSRAT